MASYAGGAAVGAGSAAIAGGAAAAGSSRASRSDTSDAPAGAIATPDLSILFIEERYSKMPRKMKMA
jgi:hypothetical protein